MEGNGIEICIWFKNGQVAYFTDVENIHVLDDKIFFTYFGRSSQKVKDAEFDKKNIAGWAITKS